MPDNASAPQGTSVATRDNSDVGQFQRQLESRARDIQMALPGHITPDKFQRTVLTAVAQNPDLLRADRPSLILACYKAAQDALLPDGREAALVTFNTRFKDPEDGQWKSKKLVQYMPMVYGLRKKILQSSEVISLEVNVVYRAEVANGTFLYEVGLEPPLRHRPSLELTEEETDDDQIIAAYSIATMRDGTKSYEIMRRFEINKVRQVSQTGATGKTDRQGKPIVPKGPWVDWFSEMAKKTVMRRHAKTLPMSGDVLIDVEGRELERGSSTAFALGSDTPDEPTLITDESGDRIDTETGEVVEEGNGSAGEDTGSSEQQAKPEPESGSTATTAKKPAAASRSEKKEPAKEEPNPPAPMAEAEAEQLEPGEPTLGEESALDEPHPGKAIADKIIAEINAPETNAVIDVANILNRNQLDIASLPDELAINVEVAADKKRNAIRETLEKAKAKEPAE